MPSTTNEHLLEATLNNTNVDNANTAIFPLEEHEEVSKDQYEKDLDKKDSWWDKPSILIPGFILLCFCTMFISIICLDECGERMHEKH